MTTSTDDLAQLRAQLKAALDARDFCTITELAEPARRKRVDDLDDIIATAKAENRDLRADEQRRFNAIGTEIRELDVYLERANADGRRQIAERRVEYAKAQAASQAAAERWANPAASIRLGAEPRTYDLGSEQRGVSFLRDVASAALGSHDRGVAERLTRHLDEARVDGWLPSGPESRDIGTSAVTGLVVPQYLTDLVAPAARSMAPTVSICNRHPLPPDGMTVNISRITTGSAVAAQATENAGVQETDIDDTLLTVNVRTYSGQQDLSRQAVERGTGVDLVTLQDLTNAYWTSVDSAVLNADGTGGTHLGIRSTASISTTTYTDADPTAGELWPKFGDSLTKTQTALFMGASHFIMHPRRWWWLASRTGTDRPFLGVEDAGDQGGRIGDGQYFSQTRQIFGIPVVVDGSIPTNVGAGTEDVILTVTASELHFWDDGVQYIRAEQPGAGSLTVKFVVYGYSAFTAGRYPGAQGVISGTGLIAPTF